MELYRICLTKYSKALVSSNYPGRWNKKGESVIYTASNRSLACLENLVHRSGASLATAEYSVLTIKTPEKVSIQYVGETDRNWLLNPEKTQDYGSEWYLSMKTCLLCVPSSIIPYENNFIINTRHAEFEKIIITETLVFEFDRRLKELQKYPTYY